ncbi:MAG TPA: hypothetical protein VGX28_16350 [Frankiaceae bacterium]|jgi:hypothetical protein|nr:hypothetical protein [Frankiaceae bacterium]
MTDERMDERLREYAARWAAARPAPASVPLGRQPRRTGWVPVAAAASVVALVAGIAYAVAPRRSPAPPPPLASASVPPVPTAPACGQSQVRGEVAFRPTATYVDGTLDLWTAGPTCTIPHVPTLSVVGDGLRDLGVTYRFAGDDVPVVLTAAHRRLSLTWSPPFCAQTQVVVLMVTIRTDDAFRLPLDKAALPECDAVDRGPETNVLHAQWEHRHCTTADWQVVSSDAATGEHGVTVTAVLRNVSADFCDPYAKPFLGIRTADGRDLDLGHVSTMDLRSGPGVPPGGQVRAEVLWTAYCGPHPGGYDASMTVHGARLALALRAHPVPPCRDQDEDTDGSVATGWLTPLP